MKKVDVLEKKTICNRVKVSGKIFHFSKETVFKLRLVDFDQNWLKIL